MGSFEGAFFPADISLLDTDALFASYMHVDYRLRGNPFFTFAISFKMPS